MTLSLLETLFVAFETGLQGGFLCYLFILRLLVILDTEFFNKFRRSCTGFMPGSVGIVCSLQILFLTRLSFMYYVTYLANYEIFAERLADMHTFASLPSVLLIDDFDTYIRDYNEKEVTQDLHIARTCSAIFDMMNSCSRILKTGVYVCAWTSSAMNNISTYMIYFVNIWNVTNEEESNTILLEKYTQDGPTEECPAFRYLKLGDGSRVLKQIFYNEIVEEPTSSV